MAFALAQSKLKSETTATRSPTITLDAAPTQGNLLVAMVAVSLNAGASAFTTPSGWTAHPDGGINQATDCEGIIYWKEAGAGESATITFTNVIAVAKEIDFCVMEFSGGTAWTADGHAENTNSGSNTLTSGTTGTTAQANEVACAFFGAKNTCTMTTPTNSFTLQHTHVAGSNNASHVSSGFLYKILSGTGTQSTGVTGTNTRPWVGQILTWSATTATTFNQSLTATAVAVTGSFVKQVGKILAAIGLSFTDDFNRADNTSSLGASWTGSIRPSGWPSHGISSNKLYPSSAYKSSYYNTQLAADQEASATLSTVASAGSNPWTEIVVRVQNPNSASLNSYQLRVNNGSSYIIKTVAGTETTIGGNYGAGADGDVFKLGAVGTTITAYKNGSQIGSVTDSSVSGAGYAGISSGDDTSIRVDDFLAQEIGGGAVRVLASLAAVTAVIVNKALTATAVVVTGTMTKRVGKGLTATAVAVTGAITKQVNKILFADVADVLLIHADGADGSTTFTDSSPRGRTITVNGNAQVDTAQSKFGGASALFDGTGDFLTVADHPDFDFGAGDFTIDLWMRLNSTADTGIIVGKRIGGPPGPFVIYRSGTGLYFYSSSDGVAWDISNGQVFATGLTTGNWNHVAVTRQGNTFRGFWNGALAFSFTNSSALVQVATPVAFGAYYNGAEPEDGWLDEIRISKGVARWTAAFTPPTAAYGSGGGVYIIPSMTALRVFLKALTATAVVVTGTMSRQVGKILSASSVVTGTMVKRVNKALTATAVAVTGTLVGIKVILRTLTATPVVVTGTMTRAVTRVKAMTATAVAVTGSLVKQVGKRLTATNVTVTGTDPQAGQQDAGRYQRGRHRHSRRDQAQAGHDDRERDDHPVAHQAGQQVADHQRGSDSPAWQGLRKGADGSSYHRRLHRCREGRCPRPALHHPRHYPAVGHRGRSPFRSLYLAWCDRPDVHHPIGPNARLHYPRRYPLDRNDHPAWRLIPTWKAKR